MEKFKGLQYWADLHKMPKYDEHDRLQSDIYKLALQAKEDTLKGVITQVLGPEPWKEEQIKDFGFIHHTSYPHREFVSYKGQLIGEIALEITMNDIYQTRIAYVFTYINNFPEKS